MENKMYICKSCGADLRDTGAYRKVYDNYIYSEHTNKFEHSSTDDNEGYICSQCDEYIQI